MVIKKKVTGKKLNTVLFIFATSFLFIFYILKIKKHIILKTSIDICCRRVDWFLLWSEELGSLPWGFLREPVMEWEGIRSSRWARAQASVLALCLFQGLSISHTLKKSNLSYLLLEKISLITKITH